MEKKARVVVYSDKALDAIHGIFDYGTNAFSPISAETFILELLEKTDALAENSLLYTECRFLPIKTKMCG